MLCLPETLRCPCQDFLISPKSSTILSVQFQARVDCVMGVRTFGKPGFMKAAFRVGYKEYLKWINPFICEYHHFITLC